MIDSFRTNIESLHPSFEKLLSMVPVRACDLPKNLPARGIYLFSEGDKHWYVGRTNRLRKRLAEHCRRSSGHNSAPFAFLLAREATKKHSIKGRRRELQTHKVFGPAFLAAKERVSNMDVRWVEEPNPLRQALLEIYVAIALDTKFNSFENH